MSRKRLSESIDCWLRSSRQKLSKSAESPLSIPGKGVLSSNAGENIAASRGAAL